MPAVLGISWPPVVWSAVPDVPRSYEPYFFGLINLNHAPILNDQLHDAIPDAFYGLLNGLGRKRGQWRLGWANRRRGLFAHDVLLRSHSPALRSAVPAGA